MYPSQKWARTEDKVNNIHNLKPLFCLWNRCDRHFSVCHCSLHACEQIRVLREWGPIRLTAKKWGNFKPIGAHQQKSAQGLPEI